MTHKRLRPFFSSESDLVAWFILGALATVFDAVSSYFLIKVYGVALEGNPVWGRVAETFSFEWAMVLRATVGVSLLLILLVLGNRPVREDGTVPLGKGISRFGVRFTAIILTALCVWHTYGTVMTSIALRGAS